MRYLINDLISTTLAVYEAAIQVKSTNLIKSRFKIKNMEIQDIFYINLHLKDS